MSARRGPWGATAERGQGTAELAIVIPLLALIAFGALDLGRVFSVQIALVNAAREGARFCALSSGSSSGLVARVQDDMGTFANALEVSPAPACVVDQASGLTSVSLTARFAPITPLIGTVTANEIRLSASASMLMG